MSDVSTFRTIVNSLLKGDEVLDNDDKDRNIQRAVEEYQRRRPLRKTVQLTGDGTRFFSVPSDWKEGFSFVPKEFVEYPLGEQPSTYIDENYVRLKNTPSGIQFEFTEGTYPANGDNFYFTYYTIHTVGASSSTVYAQDERAVATLAASYCCESLAAYYGKTMDSTIAADAVAYRDKAARYLELSEDYKEDFEEAVPDTGDTEMGDHDVTTSIGTQTMFHERYRR